MNHTLSDINQMDQATFVAVLGPIFEDTPEIARQGWALRPVATVSDLHDQMVAIALAMPEAEQRALILAHPDLGSRLQMAEASVQEQAGGGLDQLSAAEYDQIHQLNTAYKGKFGLPFVMADKGQSKASILAAFETRLNHSPEQEHQRALAEIAQIARFRLRDLIQEG